eukprot:TRINITY_DN62000_c0_g1_i1.p1 TRINITY_DN62000_c0_g1~~TRINITY_DN62000_c0_g1_i1.p1  ORF type:complete len:635 (-),score=56.23 TRINITY_DN62000_c0_g1_i1:1389-3176(-)
MRTPTDHINRALLDLESRRQAIQAELTALEQGKPQPTMSIGMGGGPIDTWDTAYGLARDNDFTLIWAALDQHPTWLNTQKPTSGWTLLHQAAYHCNVESITQLLKRGAHPCLKGTRGDTPQQAIRMDAQKKDLSLMAATEQVLLNGIQLRHELATAAATAAWDKVLSILEKYPAWVNARAAVEDDKYDEELTPLHHAAQFGNQAGMLGIDAKKMFKEMLTRFPVTTAVLRPTTPSGTSLLLNLAQTLGPDFVALIPTENKKPAASSSGGTPTMSRPEGIPPFPSVSDPHHATLDQHSSSSSSSHNYNPTPAGLAPPPQQGGGGSYQPPTNTSGYGPTHTTTTTSSSSYAPPQQQQAPDNWGLAPTVVAGPTVGSYSNPTPSSSSSGPSSSSSGAGLSAPNFGECFGAACNQNWTLVESSLKQHPEWAEQKDTRTGQTLLHQACKHGQVSITQQLVELGANPVLQDTTGHSPALLTDNTVMQSILSEAARERHQLADFSKNYDWTSVIQVLKRHMYWINVARPQPDGKNSKWTPFHQVAYQLAGDEKIKPVLFEMIKCSRPDSRIEEPTWDDFRPLTSIQVWGLEPEFRAVLSSAG